MVVITDLKAKSFRYLASGTDLFDALSKTTTACCLSSTFRNLESRFVVKYHEWFKTLSFEKRLAGVVTAEDGWDAATAQSAAEIEALLYDNERLKSDNERLKSDNEALRKSAAETSELLRDESERRRIMREE